jgi:hypothetical protein
MSIFGISKKGNVVVLVAVVVAVFDKDVTELASNLVTKSCQDSSKLVARCCDHDDAWERCCGSCGKMNASLDVPVKAETTILTEAEDAIHFLMFGE